MLFKIRSIPLHFLALSSSLSSAYVPARVGRIGLVACQHSFKPPLHDL